MIVQVFRVIKNIRGERPLLSVFIRLIFKKFKLQWLIPNNCNQKNKAAEFDSCINITLLRKNSNNWFINKYVIDKYLTHEFDILGSGWTSADLDSISCGLLGYKYNSYSSYANRGKTTEYYKLIDWHRDFKSGYRFDSDLRSEKYPEKFPVGVDIKIPWELSRLQHLPQMALAGLVFLDLKDYLGVEFVNEFYDFTINNPIGFGINWVCPMEIAIRSVNLLIAYDIFLQNNFNFSDDFKFDFQECLLTHGNYLIHHLEKNLLEDKSGNHYLSDLCGLIFISSYFSNEETRRWFEFATREFLREIDNQIFDDGGNYEYSSAYQRLDIQLIAYSCALLLRKGIEIDKQIIKKIWNAKIFLEKCIFPNGNIIQIGDNDSGFLLKLIIPGQMKKKRDVFGIESYSESIDFDELIFVEDTLSAESSKAALEALFGIYNNQLPDSSLIGLLSNNHCICVPNEISGDNFFAPPEISESFEHVIETRICIGRKIIPTLSIFIQFGLGVFEDKNFRLFVRIPTDLKKGKSIHIHNDLQHFEVYINGINYFSDQGSFLYTPNLEMRNAFRGTKAHNVPYYGVEQNKILGCWKIQLCSTGQILEFDNNHIVTRLMYGNIVHERAIFIEGNFLRIVDSGNRFFTYEPKEFKMISTGYGISYERGTYRSLPVEQIFIKKKSLR